jgi:hypothetical protein
MMPMDALGKPPRAPSERVPEIEDPAGPSTTTSATSLGPPGRFS